MLLTYLLTYLFYGFFKILSHCFPVDVSCDQYSKHELFVSQIAIIIISLSVYFPQ